MSHIERVETRCPLIVGQCQIECPQKSAYTVNAPGSALPIRMFQLEHVPSFYWTQVSMLEFAAGIGNV